MLLTLHNKPFVRRLLPVARERYSAQRRVSTVEKLELRKIESTAEPKPSTYTKNCIYTTANVKASRFLISNEIWYSMKWKSKKQREREICRICQCVVWTLVFVLVWLLQAETQRRLGDGILNNLLRRGDKTTKSIWRNGAEKEEEKKAIENWWKRMCVDYSEAFDKILSGFLVFTQPLLPNILHSVIPHTQSVYLDAETWNSKND